MEYTAILATEVMAVLIILILIYANNFEVKQRTLKRKLFNVLLFLNEAIVVADVITYLPLDWKGMPFLFSALITATYTLPSVMKVTFSAYLYEHISEKASVSRIPFRIMRIYSEAEFIILLLLCLTQNLFYVEEGVYYPGPMAIVYILLTFASMGAFMVLFFVYAKKLGVHGILAVMPFCVLPILSLIIFITTGLAVTVSVFAFSMLILYIMLQSEHESSLFNRAHIDDLTGLFNRTSYGDEINALLKAPKDTLIYASADLNGLKVTNDTLGHAAGDEMISGAAECLKKVFNGLGKAFRIGGDEFAVIFYADPKTFDIIKKELISITTKWKGKHVSSLSLSLGFASKKEFPDADIVELSKIADKRMYEDKHHFYTQKGMDRRGVSTAYKVLTTLYIKILKINITDDSFTIIDMDSNEKKSERGFAEHISDWLSGFAKSGQVHPEDSEDFLFKTDLNFMREYFKIGKTELLITYRRMYGTEFRQTMMEIIPSEEYTHDNQVLYLYVKRIG